MLALFPKVPKIQRPKALKIDVFDHSTVVWRLLSREPLQIEISAQTYIMIEKPRVIVLYIFAADSEDLSSFKFSL